MASFVATLGLSLAATSCRCEQAAPSGAVETGAPSPKRGERVVVEESAAQFFEGTVLSDGDGGLTVQTVEDGDPVRVSASDAYRVPSPPRSPKTGMYAVCKSASTSWVPCRLTAVAPSGVKAEVPDGTTIEPQPHDVLEPSPVTEINVKRHFERHRARSRFLALARAAGRPRAPAKWAPDPRELVLAKREDGWYAAYVVELDDDSIRLKWRERARESWVSPENIVPQPPYELTPAVGEFGLVRPEAPAAVWQVSQIVGIAREALTVVDVTGLKRSVLHRDFVPLFAPPR